MKHKIWTSWVVIATGLLLLIVAIVNYTIDPYAQYKDPKAYINNQRVVLPGLSENLDYESIILGTSMTENFDINQINELFDTNVIKLSMAGASLREQYEIANKALGSEKEIETVFWGLDFFKFNIDDYNYDKSEISSYLLDGNRWNDYKYLISLKTLNDAIKLYNYNHNIIPYFQGGITDLEKYAYWGDFYDFYDFNETVVLEDYSKVIKEINDTKTFNMSPTKTIVDYIKPIIRANPNVEFNLFLTAPSILYYSYANRMNENSNEMINEIRLALVEELGHLSNVNLFDFSIEKEWTHNLDNYKDVSHYKPEINKEMMERIFNNENVINSDNVEAINKEFLKQVSSYEAP
ncbi:hypothetical protein [Caryophanon latum]|uniref:Uncharacterized protein n=1 Tax=Caryophanon latum TaxID=33977 RepID=A0A1C0YIP8_9BACL|nr:hypothetical protein [Caryophanon latum]OCS87048.1 hypothetical protein A6K76_14030 [Caryophanon latum]